jgi:hypothetical protein
LGILDEVDLEASPDRESPTRCGDSDHAGSAVDCCNEDFLAGWYQALVLKYPRMRPGVRKKGSRKESAPG